jgi:hypothetical protein
MKAIVSIAKTSQGETVTLLGSGETESEARIAAFAALNHGANNFDQEFDGGELVEVSQELTQLMNAKGWDETYTEDGELLGSDANANHLKLMAALSYLYVKNGRLHFRDAANV